MFSWVCVQNKNILYKRTYQEHGWESCHALTFFSARAMNTQVSPVACSCQQLVKTLHLAFKQQLRRRRSFKLMGRSTVQREQKFCIFTKTIAWPGPQGSKLQPPLTPTAVDFPFMASPATSAQQHHRTATVLDSRFAPSDSASPNTSSVNHSPSLSNQVVNGNARHQASHSCVTCCHLAGSRFLHTSLSHLEKVGTTVSILLFFSYLELSVPQYGQLQCAE